MFTKRLVTTMGGSSFQKGIYSLLFDGSNEYIQLPRAYTDQYYAISAWLKMTAGGNKLIFDSRDGAGDGFALYNGADETNILLSGSVPINDGGQDADVWYNLVGSSLKSSGTFRIYKNGAFVDQAAGNIAHSVTTHGRIGSRSFLVGNYWVGSIADVAIYDIGFTNDAVRQVYSGGGSVLPGGDDWRYNGINQDELQASQFYQAWRLNRGERVGTKGIELHMNPTSTNGDLLGLPVGLYTQMAYTEQLRYATLKNGQLEVYFA